MKNLRKWIALAAAMAMTATLLTGCGSSEAPASEAAASTADSSTAVATAPAETTAADRELAAFYGIEVKRNGMACCPFHDDKNPIMKTTSRRTT